MEYYDQYGGANEYVDLRMNGRLFPFWILKNFKQYKLPPIIRKDNEDPCNINEKLEIRKYQEFIGKYIGPTSPYNEILLYHGLGSGKTATSINLLNILYNYDHNYNFIILIKASLRDDPWMKDLKVWLDKGQTDDFKQSNVFKRIHFIHYDSPYADRDFIEQIKKIDTSYPTFYIIDEVHNFIRNVYSNINSKLGKRAQVIYEYIVREKKENKNTKIVLISATPGVNVPFEFALIFNLLRPGIFPSSESEFNRLFVTESNYPILNPLKKNMFERRILGLTSYYIGATSDLYAKQELEYVNLPMSRYQYDIYRFFEKKESDIHRKMARYGKSSQLYRTYTRQACNFVFPNVGMKITGELRPRPGLFNVSEKDNAIFEKGKQIASNENFNKYIMALNSFITETEKYFNNIHNQDVKLGRTIYDDLDNFKNGFNTIYGGKFIKFFEDNVSKSRLFTEMYDCSPKMLAIVFMTHVSPGKAMVYTNYVVMEGIDMLKMYFRLIGFNDYKNAPEWKGYCEYHGKISFDDRVKIKDDFNSSNNIKGNICKVIIFSPSAAEGIQLLNIRQEHILEPYWTEVRIFQVIGRGIRQCSHKELPMNERVVNVYRYKTIKPSVLDSDDTNRLTTDEYIEDLAKAKDNLIQSFLNAIKESSVDCELFKEHNMMSQDYQCFRFTEESVRGRYVGPAFRDDLKEDIKYDLGLHAANSTVERIKVIKIKGVYKLPDQSYSEPDYYWYYPKNGTVYDNETHYPIGTVEMVDDIPDKIDNLTYVISDLIYIPTIEKIHGL